MTSAVKHSPSVKILRDAHHRIDSCLNLGDLRMYFLDEVVFDSGQLLNALNRGAPPR